jgi:hypothetical protein
VCLASFQRSISIFVAVIRFRCQFLSVHCLLAGLFAAFAGKKTDHSRNGWCKEWGEIEGVGGRERERARKRERRKGKGGERND